ncbi:MAG: response regulator [Rhodocyclales bacterium]|nr:response regulator [Rhodocyclales bacterium]
MHSARTSSPAEDEAVLSEQVRGYIVGTSLQNVAGAAALTLMVFAVQKGVAPHYWAPTLLAHYFVTLGRAYVIWQFGRRPASRSSAAWGRLLTICAGLTGICWGLTSALMLPRLPTELQLFVLTVIAVVSSSSSSEGFAFVQPSHAFLLACMGPPTLWLLASGDQALVILGVMLFCFVPMTFWQAAKRNRTFIEGQRMRVRNDSLVGEIAAQRDDLDLARQKAEAAVKQLAEILDNSPVPTFVLDADHVVTHWNKACESVFGVPAQAMLGSRNAWQAFYAEARPVLADLVMNGDVAAIETLYAGKEIKASGLIAGAFHGEDYFRKFDRWLFFTAAPLRNEKGEISGAIEMLQDITERRKVEAALLHAKRTAEAATHAKSEFLANMSHEIRTPLNGVLGFARIGVRDSATGSPAHETFEHILHSGGLLRGVINDILDFSKIEAGMLTVESVPCELGPLIDESAALMGEKARAKGLAIRVDKSPQLPAACLTDPLRLQQVLINLLSNAIKFTERGGVTLTAGVAAGRLVFTVEDTGIGMASHRIQELFGAFHQADSSTTRRFGGTGLGLAITKRLVELIGGDIEVASRLGQGSRFTVSLPLIAATVPEAPDVTLANAASRRLAGLSILVAEDDDINQLVIEDLLSSEGARVVMVDNGLRAVERIAADGGHAFAVVLMDIQMPEMDGYEATGKILALAPHLPILGQTAHALPEERDKCLAAGMADLVTKPIDLEKLVSAILRLTQRGTR